MEPEAGAGAGPEVQFLIEGCLVCGCRALFETLTLGGKPKTLLGHSMGGLIAQVGCSLFFNRKCRDCPLFRAF